MPDVRLIDANALQRAFDDAHKGKPDYYCCNFLNNAGNPSTEWDCVDDILENAPTIDAQPVKHGEWIVPKNDDEQPYCSVCNWHAYGDLFTDYCPGCGSYMVGD